MIPTITNLSEYVARGEARPAFRRAYDSQLAVFRSAEGDAADGAAAGTR